MDNNSCGAKCATDHKKCCVVKSCLLPAFAVFVVFMLSEGLLHHVLLMPAYQATAAVWRPAAQMQDYFYIHLIRNAVVALIMTCLYNCIASGAVQQGKCPVGKGAKFGLKIGVIIGITNFGTVAYLPIPMSLALSWLVGYALIGLLAGIVLGLIYHKCNNDKIGNA